MQKKLLLFFLLVTCQLNAQRTYPLRPFEDYTNCTSGFLSHQGDTIWPAQFDRVSQPINNNGEHSECWIAVFKGKWGLLSPEGAIVLPFEYTDIKMSFERETFLVYKNQKIGIFNNEGKEIYPVVIDEIIAEHEESLVFKEGEKHGLFGKEMKLLIKPKYDYIDRVAFYNTERYGYPAPNYYYMLQKEDLFGLADADGNVFFDDGCCPFEFLNHPIYTKYPLLSTSAENGTGLITLRNEKLIAPENNDLYLFTLKNLKGDTIDYAFVETKEGTNKAFRVDQKRESNTYTNLIVGNHALLFNTKKTKGFLNTDFEEHVIKTPYELRFASTESHFSEEMMYVADLPFIPGSKNNCVLVLADTEIQGKYKRKVDKAYGLINVNTGKKIKPQFKMIFHKIVGDEVYYFAFEQFLEEDITSSFKVYNSALDLIDTFSMNNQYMMNFNDFFKEKDAHNGFVFKDGTGKLGAIGPNGNIIIPFIYDDLRPQYRDATNRKHAARLSAKIGDKVGTLDWNGKELIPVEFDYVQPFENEFQIAAKPNGYVLYDSLYRKVIHDCQYITIVSSSSLRHYYGSVSGYLRDKTFYAVKNDTAYAYFKDGFRILNAENINQTPNNNGLTFVESRLLIDAHGKCLLYKDHLMPVSPTVYYYQQKDSMYVFHIENGITARMVRSTLNAGIDGFLHVYEYPNKEGLISKETGEWILKPDGYFKILTDGKRGDKPTTDHFWYILKSDESRSNAMWIYDRLDKGKLERKFDVPKMNHCGEYIITRSGGKFGLYNKDFSKEVIPFEYKRIEYSQNQFFVKGFDNRWSAWTPEKGLVPLNCSDVGLTKYQNGRLIFDGDRFAIISNSFELLMPFTLITNLSDSISLSKMLGPILNSLEIRNWENYASEYSAMGRVYNNTMIVELNLVFSTQHRLTEAIYLPNKTNSLQPVLVDDIIFEENETRLISFIGERLCTYLETSVSRNKYQYLKYDNYYPFSTNDEVKIYRTYVLNKNRLNAAKLEDVFLESVNHTMWLDNFLTKVINQKQLFGLQCMNLPAVLDEYKSNFYLVSTGICFSLANNHKPIVIPWGDLKGQIRKM
jgi:hypothetical protein